MKEILGFLEMVSAARVEGVCCSSFPGHRITSSFFPGRVYPQDLGCILELSSAYFANALGSSEALRLGLMCGCS